MLAFLVARDRQLYYGVPRKESQRQAAACTQEVLSRMADDLKYAGRGVCSVDPWTPVQFQWEHYWALGIIRS